MNFPDNRLCGLSRRQLLFATPALACAAQAAGGPRPSPRQLAWHRMETYAFLHFTVNTFTDKEWGYGDEDPKIFNPTQFDADAMVLALKAGGMKGVILTCKHHDGFCLWPTRTTEHSIRASGWRGGKGDVVKEVSEAARRHGLKFGVYLSPWDRNNAAYGRPEYVKIYREQLRELLTGYGPIYEVWHDGANGGDGYYGGEREKRLIDKTSYYQWPGTWDMVRKLQPNAVVFSDVGPDIRWVGNEKGIAAETCWATYDPAAPDGGPAAPGLARFKEGTTGHRNASHWMPAECDVSIRPGWFWHEKENGKVKTPQQLVDLYYQSVGRGASFLLNIPPDRRGLLHENDVAALKEFGRLIQQTFARNLAGKPKAQNAGAEVTVDLAKGASFNVIGIREDIRQGQRVDNFTLERLQAGEWKPVAAGTSIGACRLVRLGAAVAGEKLRLRIGKFSAPPVISELGVYTEAS